MDVQRNGIGTDNTGEMQLCLPMTETDYYPVQKMERGETEKACASQRKNVLRKRASSVEENLSGSTSDNETLINISGLSTENDLAAISFSRGEKEQIEMQIQFKIPNDSFGTTSEAMKYNCTEDLGEDNFRDVITDIEKLLGVEVVTVKRGPIDI